MWRYIIYIVLAKKLLEYICTYLKTALVLYKLLFWNDTVLRVSMDHCNTLCLLYFHNFLFQQWNLLRNYYWMDSTDLKLGRVAKYGIAELAAMWAIYRGKKILVWIIFVHILSMFQLLKVDKMHSAGNIFVHNLAGPRSLNVRSRIEDMRHLLPYLT